MRATIALVLACVGSLSVNSAHADDYDGDGYDDGPQLASVTIDSVVIAPFDTAGMKWDGGRATQEELQWVSDQTRKLAEKKVNTYTTIAAITAFALRVTASLVEPPDVKGSAQMIFDGKPQRAMTLPKIQDSYTPRWSGLSWQHVALDHDVRIRFVLTDNDAVNDDPIGTAVINSADLRAAAANGKTFSINVADQPNGRILAVNVFVVME